MSKAFVRQQVEKIAGVRRTWFEWNSHPDNIMQKTLVVEVDFSTDPGEDSHQLNTIEAIERTAQEAIARDILHVTALKIIPAR